MVCSMNTIDVDRTVAKLERELAIRDDELDAKAGQLAERNKEIASLSEQLFKHQKEIERLTRKPDWLRWAYASALPRTFPIRPWYVRAFDKARQRIPRRGVTVISQSPFFDQAWYMNKYPELSGDSLAKRNPALHYLKKGGFEGRNPGPGFDSNRYLAQNPDVRTAKVNPLLHYTLYGAYEGRSPGLVG